jgi:predicted house-cleaning noncanonical NTP pyrophosphatase (MazG superfamily)
MKKIIKYDKLVRDKIPQVLDSKGITYTTRIVIGQEYLDRLITKLKEEVEEFAKDNNEEEIADIMEVLHTIIVAHGFSSERIEAIRKNKLEERGGFSAKLVLEQTEE